MVVLTMYTNGQVQPRLVLPVGHTSFVNTASFSADGKYVTPIAEPFSMNELKGLSEEEVVKKIVESVEVGINEYIKKK